MKKKKNTKNFQNQTSDAECLNAQWNNNNVTLSKDWPVNANLDLALELLQPIKVKQTLPNTIGAKNKVNWANKYEDPK